MIRGPRATDQGYVTKSWSKSILRGTHAWERHGAARSGHQINSLIDDVLGRKDTKVLLRVKPHDPDAIQAFVVFAEGHGAPTVHYLYTRADEQQHGFASALLHQIGVRRDAEVICTSDGPSSTMMRTLYPHARHVPLAMFLRPQTDKETR